MIFSVLIFVIICFVIKRYVLEKLSLDNLKKRHVIVTGCDHGFGHLLTLKLLENGIPTFAGCLTEKGKLELEKKCKFMKGTLWTVMLDVTNDECVNKASEFVKSKLKNEGLWGLVCNAGIAATGGPDDWLNIEDYKKLLDVNTLGVIRTCHAFKPLIKKGKGRIVIMTSMLGRVAWSNMGPYCVSKFAAEAYADVLRLEGKCFGYTVHILEPGFFQTNINCDSMTKVFQNSWDRLNENTKEEYGEEFLNEGKKAIPRNLRLVASNNVNHVVDAYYNALTSRFPRLRYHIGIDSKYITIPLATFWPTYIQDVFSVIMQRVQGLPVPAVCKK